MQHSFSVRSTLIPLLLIFIVPFLHSQPPKYEVRAVWISAASGDWPRSNDAAEQQRSLIDIFDLLKRNNFNTVFFQVRPRGNVLYRSSIEPWAPQLAGVMGKDPGYDPLEFAVEQAHKRGLEIHAWFNVAKVWGSEQLPQNPQHVTRTHRNWVKMVENEWWLDMGIPEARDYTERLVSEIISTYDVDGIHFDYVRYPSDKFDDWGSFSKWSDGVERSEWRRNNITAFVRDCYTMVQKERPWIKVGSAPLGIYQSIAGAQSTFNGYSGVFQDSRRWLRERIHDYIAPQLYWSIGEQKNPNDPDFFALSNDWVQENYDRHVYIGIGAYRENVQSELREQVITTRVEGANGQAFFRYENIGTVLSKIGELYKYPVLFPVMSWKDSVPPNSPKSISVNAHNGNAVVRWSEPDASSDKEKPVRYIVYRSLQKDVDTKRAENIIAVIPSSERSFRDENIGEKQFSYTVTAVDRAGNESGRTGTTVTEVQSLFSRYSRPQQRIALLQSSSSAVSGKAYICYELPKRTMVTIALRPAAATQESVVVRQIKEAGMHILSVDTKLYPPGAIEYRLSADGTSATGTIETR
ncbi:MAG: glycoside hydrolase family 10 protein [Bacteroidota bacterium]